MAARDEATGRAPAQDAPFPHRRRDLWTPERARLWLVACVVAAYLPALGVPLRRWLDFSAFYAAGSLALTPDVSKLAPIVTFQAQNALPITPFVYPPGVALLYAPLARLPYDLAAAVHVVLMLGLLVLAARLGADLYGLPPRWALLGTLAWAPAAAGVLSGQNTPLALLLALLAARSLARRDDAAPGLLTGVLAYKPQLAAPFTGLLLLRGRWRALVVVAVVVLGHYAAGVAATGGNLGWPSDWVATLREYSEADLRANGWQAVSLPALLARVGLEAALPWLTIVGYAAGGLIVLACLPALRRWPPEAAVALACAAGLVVSPHAWVYDATLLLPGVALFTARSAARGWPVRDRWLLAGAYGVALTWPLGGLLGFTLLAAVVVASPIVLLRGRPEAWTAPSPASP